jgi:hypothetical protein
LKLVQYFSGFWGPADGSQVRQAAGGTAEAFSEARLSGYFAALLGTIPELSKLFDEDRILPSPVGCQICEIREFAITTAKSSRQF